MYKENYPLNNDMVGVETSMEKQNKLKEVSNFKFKKD